MAKLYFKYGTMGSSKTAQALITKFNYEEKGMIVWLLKPSIDDRDGITTIKSRIGIEAEANIVEKHDNLIKLYEQHDKLDVIIVDECQFLTEKQIEELRIIVDHYEIPVLCYGLRTDFRTKLFPGSMRLFELADSISEIKTICDCGKKATVNCRLDAKGNILTQGEQVCIGGNEKYVAMCNSCRVKKLSEALLKEKENK